MPSRIEAAILLCLTLDITACVAPPRAADFTAGVLCRPDERAAFHCPLARGAVAVCARMDGARIAAVNLRLGTPAALERDYAAPAAGTLQAQTQVLGPAAQLDELWFDDHGSATVVGQCLGGDCLSEAGVSVIEGGRLVAHRDCVRNAQAQPWFSSWLLRFGEAGAPGASATPAIVFGSAGHPLAGAYLGTIVPR